MVVKYWWGGVWLLKIGSGGGVWLLEIGRGEVCGC